MSRSSPIELDSKSCDHSSVSCGSSTHALDVGYRRPTAQQRQNATSLSGRSKKVLGGLDDHFPAPLVLPGDDLAMDPSHLTQSIRSWEKDRNKITPERRTIYVAAPPNAGSEVSFMKTWSRPKLAGGSILSPPDIDDVVDYLSAFYHGLPVKQLPPPKLSFTTWDSDGTGKSKTKRKSTKSTNPSFIGLNTSTNCIQIRARAPKDGIFHRQLNLDDLLDAAIEMLPEDAYALLLLVNHDLYEDEDDEFVCGRAYGGSRVAVISTARYHPGLDSMHDIDRQHAWPASHCAEYMETCCESISTPKPKKSKKENPKSQSLSVSPSIHEPLQAALDAHKSLSSASFDLPGLWLTRVCRTSGHKLGHCFGMDHCVYCACSMQGTSRLMEDTCQPPYLCPVDLAKMLTATGSTAKERYLALFGFCRMEKHRDTHLFVAFGAWIQKRLEELDRINE